MSSGGARRRGRNALDKCPGYEPNPAFAFLERCRNCGFTKAEHKIIVSEGASLFSYLGIEESFAAIKEQLPPVVQSYLPTTARNGVKEQVVLKKVDGNEEKQEKAEQKTVTLRAQQKNEAPVTSLQPPQPPAPVAQQKQKAEQKTPTQRAEQKNEAPVTTAQPLLDVSRSAALSTVKSPAEHERKAPAESAGTNRPSSTRPQPESESSEPQVGKPGTKGTEPSAPTPAKVPALADAGSLSASITEPEKRTSIITEKRFSLETEERDPVDNEPPEEEGDNQGTRRAAHMSALSIASKRSRFSAIPSRFSPATARADGAKKDEDNFSDTRQAHLARMSRIIRATDTARAMANLHFRKYEEPCAETLRLYANLGGSGIVWNAKMSNGWTPLHVAAWNRDVAGIRKYADKFLNATASDTNESALSIATKRGSLCCVQELLKRKADTSLEDTFGYCPVHYAARLGDVEILRLVADATDSSVLTCKSKEIGLTVLHLAARHAGREVFDLILERMDDINVVDKRGWTPLHYAVMRHGQADLVSHLLDSGANASIVDTLGLSLLHCAVLADDSAIVELMVERGGCRMDSVDVDSWSPLHYCARYNASVALATLIEFGARPSPKDMTVVHPVDIARHFEFDNIVTVLERARGFRNPAGVRNLLDCEDSRLSAHERVLAELDLAEVTSILAALSYVDSGSSILKSLFTCLF